MKYQDQHVFKSKAAPKPGRLLLSDPHLNEDFFKRAAVLLVAHDTTESFGLVLNHKSALLLSDIFEHIELDLPIFNGGPVEQEQLFYLHRFADITDATKVTEHLYFGGDWKEVLKQAHLLPKPQTHIRLFAGYAGWGAGQLNEELSEHSWICTSAYNDKKLLLEDRSNLWKKCMLQQGPYLALFAHFPLNVADN